jgi:hypothetical protein
MLFLRTYEALRRANDHSDVGSTHKPDLDLLPTEHVSAPRHASNIADLFAISRVDRLVVWAVSSA